MNQSMERSKILQLNRRNSLGQEDDLYRTMRTNSSKIPIPFSTTSEQTRKLIERLQKLVKEQKQKREDIEMKYEQFKQRNVNRERQFNRILSNFDTHIPGDSKEEDYDNYVKEIYKNILCTFEAFNEKARSLLDDRYSELYRLMERRIDLLMQKMDKELVKYKKISFGQRKQLQQAIREIGVIAAQTQSQNVEFRKKNEFMELRLKMLNDQKRLLLEEITSLKAYIKEGRKSDRQKQKGKGRKSIVKGEFWNNIESIQVQRAAEQRAKNQRSLTSRTYRYQQPSYKNTNNNTISIKPNRTIDMYKHSSQSISQQNIISHLRQQLQRQKNKNTQLIKFSLQLQAKHFKITEIVSSEINSIVTRASQNSLQNSMTDVNDGKDLESQLNSSEKMSYLRIDGGFSNVFDDKTKHKVLNKDLVIRTSNLTFQEVQQQLLQQQKKFSLFVTSIHKILQLPQHYQIDFNSFNNNHIDPSIVDTNILSLKNHLKYPKSPNSIINSQRTQKQQINTIESPKINLHLIPQNESHFINKSMTKRYESQNRTKKINSFFVNYSPLDIMDITRSIEIK